MKKVIGGLLIFTALVSTVLMPKVAYAVSDTTDGYDEIFYEWVESYDNIHSDTYNYDLDTNLNHREYIDFHENDAFAATSNVVENLATTIRSDLSNPWYISN